MLLIGAAVAVGNSSGTRTASTARHQRDTAIAEAYKQRDTTVATANDKKNTAVAAANDEKNTAVLAAQQQRDKVLASETEVVNRAEGAKTVYDTKLASLGTRSGQLDKRENAVKQREDAATKREQAVTSAEQGLQANTFDNGVLLVGHDIQPGTYQTAGPDSGGSDNCYYARLSSTDTSEIIDNNNVSGSAVITVAPTDVAVESNGCQTWRKIG